MSCFQYSVSPSPTPKFTRVFSLNRKYISKVINTLRHSSLTWSFCVSSVISCTTLLVCTQQISASKYSLNNRSIQGHIAPSFLFWVSYVSKLWFGCFSHFRSSAIATPSSAGIANIIATSSTRDKIFRSRFFRSFLRYPCCVSTTYAYSSFHCHVSICTTIGFCASTIIDVCFCSVSRRLSHFAWLYCPSSFQRTYW